MTEFEEVDLRPVRERVEWAGRHLVRLRKLVDVYVAARPFAVYLYISPDRSTVTETATLTEDPPLPISLALGDIAHHLRAALDNLVGVLRLGGPNRATAFPIATTPEEFDRLAAQMLAGVLPWAVMAVRELQSFDSERGSIGASLEVINQLAQRDRHRALLLHAPLLETSAVHHPVGEWSSGGYDKHPNGTRELQLHYPLGTVVRFDYTVRVVVGEGVPGAQDEEIVGLAERLLVDLRAAVDHIDIAADAEWQRLHL